MPSLPPFTTLEAYIEGLERRHTKIEAKAIVEAQELAGKVTQRNLRDGEIRTRDGRVVEVHTAVKKTKNKKAKLQKLLFLQP